MNSTHPKVSPLTLLLFGVMGAGAGLLTQTYRSGIGLIPFAPPISLPASLLVISFLLFVLARRLKRNVAEERTEPVNPFHAVRLLAAARAAQFTGALFGGFGLGLFVMVASRVAQLATEIWLPMTLTTAMGTLLFIAGILAEHACRIPPKDGETDEETDEVDGTAQGNVSAFDVHDG